MNTRKDSDSPWGVRIYFESHEFDSLIEDALSHAGEAAFREGAGVAVDRVLWKAYGVEPDYVDLPVGLMGRTLFRRDGKARVEISRALAEAAERDQLARRRLRTTLAHEAGHLACHRSLFITDTETLPLFGQEDEAPEKPAILCREASVAQAGYQGEWWEFQANQCMARILLPKHLLVPRLQSLLGTLGVASFLKAQEEGMDEELIRAVANTFDVSWQATLFRLQELGFAPRVHDFLQGEVALPD